MELKELKLPFVISPKRAYNIVRAFAQKLFLKAKSQALVATQCCARTSSVRPIGYQGSLQRARCRARARAAPLSTSGHANCDSKTLESLTQGRCSHKDLDFAVVVGVAVHRRSARCVLWLLVGYPVHRAPSLPRTAQHPGLCPLHHRAPSSFRSLRGCRSLSLRMPLLVRVKRQRSRA